MLITDLSWSASELPALVDALCRRAGIPRRDAGVVHPPVSGADIKVWFENSSARLGVEMDSIDLWGFRIEEKLRTGGPAAVPLKDRWIALLDARRGKAKLLAPDLRVHSVDIETLRRAVAAPIEDPHRPEIEAVLDACDIQGSRREKAVAALLRERSRYQLAGACFQLRTPPGAPFVEQLQQAGLLKRIAILGGAHLAEYGLWIVAWYILGGDALQGHVDKGWLIGWILVTATLVPFRMLTTWSQGVLAIGGGGLLRQRILDGALKLSPEEVRHEGAGRFLARSIEAEQVESLALSGGLTSALAVIEIILAMAVLSQGASPVLETTLLAVWTGLATWAGIRFWRARLAWTDGRLAITHELVERMTGHRTRIAQEPPSQWHVEEDRQMDEYAARSQRMDMAAARLLSLAPAGWMAAGVAMLTPAFLSTEATASGLAVSIGGVLLAWRAIKRYATGAGNLAGAAISWRQIAALFNAASRPEPAGLVASAPPAIDLVLDVKDVGFRRQESGRTVLSGVELQLRRGDRVLIEGESGGGKSTLVSLLAGLREPTHGLLLSAGLDRRTLGDTLWRRRIVAAPQYHENHVLTGPFAYNLLMGRNWPATPEEMKEAQKVCEELGLGPLVERMPGGLMQMVGETGWQLSQGERSRLFMARALLQHSDIVILDESFAALDPENLRQALECALARVNTLVVVAHP
ncbi:MAG: ABC transporter ATP-binding protein [Acidobacteria bacterium]|nr:ABC transporter ATP-binding protein [Acidobacteriota bacterium]